MGSTRLVSAGGTGFRGTRCCWVVGGVRKGSVSVTGTVCGVRKLSGESLTRGSGGCDVSLARCSGTDSTYGVDRDCWFGMRSSMEETDAGRNLLLMRFIHFFGLDSDAMSQWL